MTEARFSPVEASAVARTKLEGRTEATDYAIQWALLKTPMPIWMIEISRDPAWVFAGLFILSLFAAIVLFRGLQSQASIKGTHWTLGGAAAGFVIILFGSWHVLSSSVSGERPLSPVSIPDGFKRISMADVGLAMAIPPSWERKETPVTVMLGPKEVAPNAPNPSFIFMQITRCQALPPMTLESDLATVEEGLKETLGGLVRVDGASINDPYLGHKGSSTPMTLTIPGGVLQPPTTQDYSLRFVAHEIYDEHNGRCLLLGHSDNELGQTISSTLNIADPPR
jgi:hypothetical protein